MKSTSLLNVTAACMLSILLASCYDKARPIEPKKSDDTSTAQGQAPKTLNCTAPYRVEFDKPFTLDVSLASTEATQESVLMKSPDVTYKPKAFKIAPDSHKYVEVTATKNTSGLVVVDGYLETSGQYNMCDLVLNAGGYPGHLKSQPVALPYMEARTLTLQIVDPSDKPVAVGVDLQLQIQSEDAVISSKASVPSGDKTAPFIVDLPSGSTTSRPFQVMSTNRRGGPVRILATLRTQGNNGSVLTQDWVTLDSEPAEWLPISLAIGGALLYALYRLVRDPDATQSGKHVFWNICAAVLGGLIAYLLADFDLLGLKLDPHVLRTYAVLGFLFSFVGIDTIISKRFASKDKPNGHESDDDKAANSQDAKAASGST